jgi:L-ribulokinase
VVVGVDFGTLLGRAVVVRVADGAELGRRPTHAHAILDRQLPDGTLLPPEWELQVPSGYLMCSATRFPQPSPRRRSALGMWPGAGSDGRHRVWNERSHHSSPWA